MDSVGVGSAALIAVPECRSFPENGKVVIGIRFANDAEADSGGGGDGDGVEEKERQEAKEY